MSTASKSLPSAYQLPIIVVMKIRFRIGAEQSNGQGSQERGKQSPRQQNWPVTPPSPWSLGSPVSSWTPPTENPADHSLRRGTARCARCNTADQATLWPAAVRYQALRLAPISTTASWPTDRSYVKESAQKLYNFTGFLTGTGLQTEVIENK